MKRIALLTFLAVLSSFSHLSAQLNREQPEALQSVGIDEKLGDTLPLDVRFATSTGDSVTLAELFSEGKPVLLNPLYYDCPMLCGLVIDGVLDVANELAWAPGNEYTIISFSIDPSETHALASDYKSRYLEQLNKPDAQDGWYFLTGNKKNIQRLVQAVGFEINEIEDTGEFAHAAAIMLVSPNGVITRYLYGIQYDEFNVRSALFEAADGKIGNTLTKVLMYCYQYDPNSNSYVPIALNFMKLGGLATLLFLGIFLGLLWLRERRKKQTSNIDFQ
ncbi:MAG: SCO family protein [Balneolaceae bacterium]|nr:SCO family protein [Balneolaceae bacterium]